MSDPDKLIEVEETENGVYIARLLPEKILDELMINEIGQQLGDLVDKGAEKLVIDFRNVDHLSSSALGMLITVRQNLTAAGGQVHLCNIQSDIFQVFKITGLDKLFAVYPGATEALTAFDR